MVNIVFNINNNASKGVAALRRIALKDVLGLCNESQNQTVAEVKCVLLVAMADTL